MVNRRVDFSDTASVLQYSYFFIPPRCTARLYFSALHVTRCITNCSEWWEPLPDLAQGKPPCVGLLLSLHPHLECRGLWGCVQQCSSVPAWFQTGPCGRTYVLSLNSPAKLYRSVSEATTPQAIHYSWPLKNEHPKWGPNSRESDQEAAAADTPLEFRKCAKKKKSIANQPLPCQPCWGNASYK